MVWLSLRTLWGWVSACPFQVLAFSPHSRRGISQSWELGERVHAQSLHLLGNPTLVLRVHSFSGILLFLPSQPPGRCPKGRGGNGLWALRALQPGCP